jgi:peptidoglycan hydrolase-like protein with peptidoglycan-binding domain
MSSFYDTILRNSPAFRSDVVCKDMAMLEPGTRAAVLALMADAKSQGIDIRVLETYRSQTRQSALFTQHATQLRVVGCHGYGVACDFGVFIDGKYQPNDKAYQFLRQAARRHGLISGIDWGHAVAKGFEDSDHVQRIPVWRQNAMFSGSWYPPGTYDPYADSIANGHVDVVGLSGQAAPPPQITQPKPVATATAPVKGSVAWVQEKLNDWAPSFRLDVDGTAGPATKYAIRRFQQEHGLHVDGVAGPQTVAALAV